MLDGDQAGCVIGNGPDKKKNGVLLRVFILLGFLLVLIILYKAGVFRFFMDRERIIDFLDSLGPIAVLGFICLQAVQVVAAPVPGEVTGFIGGYLYGPVLGILFSTIGLTAGSMIAFTLSRIFGRPFVDKFVSKQTLDKYDYLLHHKGAFLVFLLFLIPGMPKDILCYILGLGHLTSREFFVISTVGRFGGTVLLTLGGSYIRHHQYYRFSILLGVAVIVIFFSMVYKDKLERIFHRIHRRSRERHKKK